MTRQSLILVILLLLCAGGCKQRKPEPPVVEKPRPLNVVEILPSSCKAFLRIDMAQARAHGHSGEIQDWLVKGLSSGSEEDVRKLLAATETFAVSYSDPTRLDGADVLVLRGSSGLRKLVEEMAPGFAEQKTHVAASPLAREIDPHTIIFGPSREVERVVAGKGGSCAVALGHYPEGPEPFVVGRADGAFAEALVRSRVPAESSFEGAGPALKGAHLSVSLSSESTVCIGLVPNQPKDSSLSSVLSQLSTGAGAGEDDLLSLLVARAEWTTLRDCGTTDPPGR